MNARIRLNWTPSKSPNLLRQTLEVIAGVVSWGIHDMALGNVADVLAPENTPLVLILRSYNHANVTGDSATVTAKFQVPTQGPAPVPPISPTPPAPVSGEEPLPEPATGFTMTLVGWEASE